MKILHYLIGRCNPESANGVEKSVSNIIKTLGESPENEVFLFSVTDKDIIKIPNVEIFKFKPQKPSFLLPREFKKKLVDIKPDIIHLHSVYNPHNIIISKWARELGVPYVTTPHGGMNKEMQKKNKFIKLIYKHLFELPYTNNADLVHSVGDYSDIIKYGVKSRVITIPNGIELPNINSPKELVHRYPILENKKVFTFLGRIDIYIKGIDLLLESFSIANIKNSILLLIGPFQSTNDKTKLMHIIKKHNLEKKILLTGPVFGSQKYQLLDLSDIYIQLSRTEAGSPHSVLEAMSVGLPCFVSHKANPMGVIQNEISGWVTSLEINDIVKTFKKIENLEKDTLNEMGNKNIDLVKANFTWDKIVKQLMNAYQSVLKNNE
jgi:glycosyltransferase involved in cell wall biosynthesis